jgi:hypothetical protein
VVLHTDCGNIGLNLLIPCCFFKHVRKISKSDY